MAFIILNGKIVERETASIDIEDRGYQFGDGVYEVIRIYNGKMFTADEHLQRLYDSASSISIKIPYDKKELHVLLEQLIERNQVKLGTIYFQFTRGVSPRKHPFPANDVKPSFVAYTKDAERPTEKMMNGVKVIVTEDIRWLRCDIKSLNLLGNLLANQKATEAGCDEAILHRDGIVTEGSHSNIAIVKDDKIYTHPANHLILNGISRRTLLQLCERESVPVLEKSFSVSDLEDADEVFLTGTTVEVMPVVEIDGKLVKDGRPGQLTTKLQTWFKQEIEACCGEL